MHFVKEGLLLCAKSKYALENGIISGMRGGCDMDIELYEIKRLREQLIDEDLPSVIPFPVRKTIENNSRLSCLVSDEHKLLIMPEVRQRKEYNEMFLNITVVSGKYPSSIFISSVGQDEDPKTALRSALDLVKVSFMPAIKNLAVQDAYTEIETEFEGTHHSWKVYVGNVFSKKNGSVCEDHGDLDQIMKTMLPELAKRLGDQKAMAVQIKIGNFMSGASCVIDGIFPVRDLADKAREMSSMWPNTVKELYLIFEQDDSTHRSLPTEDIRQYNLHLKKYLDLYRGSESLEMDDKDLKWAIKSIGDASFVDSCRAFLPDIVAGKLRFPALSSHEYSDKVEIYTSDGVKHDVYLTQLSDYHFLKRMMPGYVNQLGAEDPCIKNLFESSQLVRYLKENNISVEHPNITFSQPLKYQMREGFEFR